MLAYQVPAFVDFGRVYLPAYDVEPDYLAQQRQRRRQIALAQAEAAERRRREKEQELAYRLALAQEFERHRRHAEYVRAQKRREEEQRRKTAHARRQRQPRALFDFLLQLQPDLLDTLASRDDGAEPDESAIDSEEEYLAVPLQAAPASTVTVADPDEVDLAATVAAAEADVSDAHSDHASDMDDSSTMQADSDSDASADEIDASAAERNASLATLASLASDFDAHRASFISPTTLTFSASPSPVDRSARSPTPPLAFGSANTPFLAYEEYLLSLLTKVDAVESHGDSAIKRARKELVKQVEAELARLDGLKEKAWEELSASASSTSSDEEADDESMSSESEEEDEEMAGPAEAETLTLSSDSDSAPDSSLSSPEPELAPEAIKIPFLPQPSRSSRLRRRSPRPHTRQPAHKNDFSPSSPPNDADDEVADVLLRAHQLGERVAQMEEAERDMADMAEVGSDGEEGLSDSSGDEDLFVLYL